MEKGGRTEKWLVERAVSLTMCHASGRFLANVVSRGCVSMHSEPPPTTFMYHLRGYLFKGSVSLMGTSVMLF